jgi:hypothetical protein
MMDVMRERGSMSFWKKLLLGIGLVIVIALGPSFLYGLLADRETVPDGLATASFVVAALVLFGLIVYLAVDLALRHQHR